MVALDTLRNISGWECVLVLMKVPDGLLLKRMIGLKEKEVEKPSDITHDALIYLERVNRQQHRR